MTESKQLPLYSLPVLLYHRIIDKDSKVGRHKIYVKKENFEKQLQFLRNNNYQTITFYDLQENPTMDLKKKVILTFDDGYEDNFTILFPLLKKYDFKAVIYLVTKQEFNDWGVAEGEPRLKMMSKEQLLVLNNYGIEFGGHTQNHIDLDKADDATRIKEITDCKKDIESIIEKQVISFAYPFGAINEYVKLITEQAGYKFAVSTNTGPKQFGDDLFQIRRIEVTPRTTLMSFKNKVSGKYFQPSLFNSLFSTKQKA